MPELNSCAWRCQLIERRTSRKVAVAQNTTFFISLKPSDRKRRKPTRKWGKKKQQTKKKSTRTLKGHVQKCKLCDCNWCTANQIKTWSTTTTTIYGCHICWPFSRFGRIWMTRQSSRPVPQRPISNTVDYSLNGVFFSKAKRPDWPGTYTTSCLRINNNGSLVFVLFFFFPSRVLVILIKRKLITQALLETI